MQVLQLNDKGIPRSNFDGVWLLMPDYGIGQVGFSTRVLGDMLAFYTSLKMLHF